MPTFEPFRALRYRPGLDLAAVTAPPYDVLSDAEVDALGARDPHNITWVDVPRGGPERYAVAARTLRGWVSEGVMERDATASMTIYRTRFVAPTGARRELVGVLGALEVVDEGVGGVLPHERVTPKASTDRLDLTRAAEANLSPVWGLSLARGLSDLLGPPGEPVGLVRAGDVEHVVEHSVERVVDPDRIASISAVIGSDDVLIADGHHRYGVGRQYRDEVRAGGGGGTGTPAELTLAYVAELTPAQLSIDAIHRLYRGVSYAQLRGALGRYFDLSHAPAPTPDLLASMSRLGRLVLLGPDGAAEWLTPKPEAFQDARALDGAWLEEALGDTTAEVSYQHGLAEVLAAVRDRSAAAGVLIRPVSIAEIERTAREGLLMPPKSTFFTPKLLTGLVVRDLRER